MNDSRLVEYIDTLIQACHDGARGFRRCAGQAQAMALQWLLTQRSQRYRKDSAELEALRAEYVGAQPHALRAPADVGAQRGWVAARSMLAGFSDLALLAECERGEDSTLRHYRRVLDEELPIVLRAVVQRHCDAALGQRAQMRSLRASLLPATPLQQDEATGAGGPLRLDVEAA